MRAVWIFCLAAMIISIVEWTGGGLSRFFPLESGQFGDFLVIPLLTYSLVHVTLSHLFLSLFGIVLSGCFLEARIGSKTTGLVMVTGVVLVGLAWKFLMPSQGVLIGSAGVAYAMAGGVARVGQKSRTEMERGERLLLVACALWFVFMWVSEWRGPLAVGMIPVISMSAGYLVVAWCRRKQASQTRATDDGRG